MKSRISVSPEKDYLIDSSSSHGTARTTIIFLILIVIVCAACLAFPRPTLGLIEKLLVVNETPVKADAVVVLLGASTPDRILRAHKLYTQGFSKKIVFASGYTENELLSKAPKGFVWPPLSSSYLVALRSLKLPSSAIELIKADHAFDTSHELSVVSRYAQEAGWTNILLVTSASHTRRVRLIWNRVGGYIPARVIAAIPDELDSWWTDGRTRRMAGYEAFALTKEFWAQTRTVCQKFYTSLRRKISRLLNG